MSSTASRAVQTVTEGVLRERQDILVVEAPLEIRWAGDVVATTMRTPGRDHDLALGFLRCEGVIGTADDVGSVFHCGRPGEQGYGNVIDVAPGPGVAVDPDKRLRRGTLVTSACGVCGRQTIEDLLSREVPVNCDTTVSLDVALDSVAKLEGAQPIFEATGGVHGAALFDHDGLFLCSDEDVGRHNTVDKLIGRSLRGEVTAAALLVVSGRLSFEIIHKAAVLQVPIVASVSAPSTLAVELADSFGICTLGFARGRRANIYTHAQRIRS